jgi:hypothetical protein
MGNSLQPEGKVLKPVVTVAKAGGRRQDGKYRVGDQGSFGYSAAGAKATPTRPGPV